MTEQIYVFIDKDHDDIMTFSNLERAKQHGWPEEEDWIKESEDTLIRGEYCFIHITEVDEY